MGLLDLIGKAVLIFYVNVVLVLEQLIEFVENFMDSIKKKVSKPSQQQQIQDLKAEFSRRTNLSPLTTTDGSGSNPFTPKNPVPGVDLLQKEGWTKVYVHPCPEANQQVLILKNEKQNTAKMLGKQAFLEYLEELNAKYNK